MDTEREEGRIPPRSAHSPAFSGGWSNANAIPMTDRPSIVSAWQDMARAKYPHPATVYEGRGPLLLIGDSHSKFWAQGNGCFTACWVGPVTAHGIRKYDSRIRAALVANPAKPALFLVGEPDCRLGIYLAMWEKGMTMEACLEEAIGNYLTYLSEWRSAGRPVYAVSVSPTGSMSNRYRAPVHPAYAWRKEITEEFNVGLFTSCIARGIPFLDVYPDLVDEDGDRRDDLAADDTHLNGEAGLILYRKAQRLGVI